MGNQEENLLPPKFLERLQAIFPGGPGKKILERFRQRPVTVFRVNRIKAGDGLDPAAELRAQGVAVERVSWYEQAYLLRGGDLRALQSSPLYREGKIYIQGLSSMATVLVLAPRPGDTVLDLAAAPGSKTSQIACLMEGRGKLVANDSNRKRFFKMRANLSGQGICNVHLTLYAGESCGRRFPNYFDRVLLDAPCSGEGRFTLSDPASYRYWKPAKIKEMAQKQRRLILSAIRTLRPGGCCVYATCTFAPEENEAIISWVFEKAGRDIQIEPVRLPFPNTMAGLPSWQGREFHPAVRHTVRILPTETMEAFFIAKLKKKGGGS